MGQTGRGRTLERSVVGLLALGLLVAACASGDGDATDDATPSDTSAPTTTASPDSAEHPIGIDGTGFVDETTGEPFVPRGVNYLTRVPVDRGFQDRTLSPAVFDRATVAADLEQLADRGYNVVRVFLDTCSSGPDCIGSAAGDGLNPAFLDTIVEFTEVVADADLFVLFTSNDLPDQGGYWATSDRDNEDGVFPGYRNSHYLTASGEEAAVAYWDDLLGGLVARGARLDAVLAWSILNEQWMFSDQPPLSSGSGEVTTKTGTYDLADPDAKRAMVVDATRSYFAAVADVIRRHDPDGLVTAGFFAPKFPNPTDIGGTWYVDTAPLVEDSALDFFDFHAYPGVGLSIEQQAENFGLPADKPVVMGEYGAFVDRFPDVATAALALQQWVAGSCAVGWGGWLYWEHHPASLSVGDATFALTGDDGFLLDALAPATQPDPCVATLEDPDLAAGATVTASRSLPEEPPEAAVDGDSATQWGSGGEPTQWIELDLGEPREIGTIRLQVAQFPEGPTRHVVTVDGIEVWTFDGPTAEGHVLEAALAAPVTGRVVRITTTASPSWVSWKEIEVLGG
ncbi:MAG: discoidin domain-containing protein [Acidimicrobiales bacterium]